MSTKTKQLREVFRALKKQRKVKIKLVYEFLFIEKIVLPEIIRLEKQQSEILS